MIEVKILQIDIWNGMDMERLDYHFENLLKNSLGHILQIINRQLIHNN